MSILDYFTDMLTLTGDVYHVVKSNVGGLPTKVETLVQTGLSVNYYTEKSVETNVNDQFVNDEVGKILIDPAKISWVPSRFHELRVGSSTYYFQGNDDVAGLGEVYVVPYRKDRK